MNEASSLSVAADRDDRLPLYRRLVFDRDLPEMVRAATSEREPLSLLMVDLDRFKQVNDLHGHPCGDGVLHDVAQVIQRCVGVKGKAYRYGGEEFAILLPNHSAQEAIALAERVRREIEGAVIGVKRLKITVSVGIASVPDQATDVATLVARADEALYEAKNLGRNLVRVHGEPRPEAPAARSAERRQPEPGALPEQQRREIREQYYRHRSARCPRDQALLEVHEIRPVGNALLSILLIACPLCGLQDTLEPE